MPHSTHPRIRAHVVKEEGLDNGRSYQVVDRLGLAPPLPLTAEEFIWLDLFDGTCSLADMPGRACLPTAGDVAATTTYGPRCGIPSS